MKKTWLHFITLEYYKHRTQDESHPQNIIQGGSVRTYNR